MYATLIFVTSFLVGSVLAAPERDPKHIFARAKCNADNCLRAIDGTRRGSSFAAAATQQCSAFLRTTVTPSPSTRIVSETTIVTLPTQYITIYVDASTPVLVPSYASACSGSVRYASACSCVGITADATTLPQPYMEITYTNTVYQTPITTLTITESKPVSSGSASSSSYHYDSSSSYSYYSSTSLSNSSTSLPSSLSSTYSYDSSYSYSYYSSIASSSFSTPSSSSSSPTATPSCNTYELKAIFQYSNFKDQVLEISQDYHFAHTLSFTSEDQHDSRSSFTLQPDGRIYGADGSGA